MFGLNRYFHKGDSRSSAHLSGDRVPDNDGSNEMLASVCLAQFSSSDVDDLLSGDSEHECRACAWPRVDAPRPEFVPSKTSASEQVVAFISVCRESGDTGQMQRREVLLRYGELCLMHGFNMLKPNVFLAALGKVCKKPRGPGIKDDGTAGWVMNYAIPAPERSTRCKSSAKPPMRKAA